MKLIQKITSIFLAALFLVSSFGFTANKMVCLKSGRVKFSLVHEKECGAETQPGITVIKGKCCDVFNSDFHLPDFQNTQKSTVEQPQAFVFLFAHPVFSYTVSASSKPLAISFADLPPPVSGRSLLAFISTFRI
jgi:hypothetical protein